MSAPPGYPGALLCRACIVLVCGRGVQRNSVRRPGRKERGDAVGRHARWCWRGKRAGRGETKKTAPPVRGAQGRGQLPRLGRRSTASRAWPGLCVRARASGRFGRGERREAGRHSQPAGPRLLAVSILTKTHSLPPSKQTPHAGGAAPSAPPAGYPGTAPQSKPVFGGGGAPPASWGGYTIGGQGQAPGAYPPGAYGGVGPAGYGAAYGGGYPGGYGGGQQMYAGGPAASSDCLGEFFVFFFHFLALVLRRWADGEGSLSFFFTHASAFLSLLTPLHRPVPARPVLLLHDEQLSGREIGGE
jgi:hypothetical protein